MEIQYNADGHSITNDILNFYIEFLYTRRFHIFGVTVHKAYVINVNRQLPHNNNNNGSCLIIM